MEQTTASFRKLLKQSRTDVGLNKSLDIFSGHVREDVILTSVDRLRGKQTSRRRLCVTVSVVCVTLMSLTPFLLPELWQDVVMYVTGSPCLIDNNMLVMEMSRPVFDCNKCRDLSAVPVEYGITKERFMEKYAYSEIPVLVKQATVNWTAMETFNFQYFKKIYTSAETAMVERARVNQKSLPRDQRGGDDEINVEDEMLACQFFPYKTEFDNLMDALNMDEDRAAYAKGTKKWYFGWSNCNEEVQAELRRHYARPHFLPDDSETSSLDWIFMGGRGRGAPMHLDSVARPSWQAQISGRKTWSLDPPPECLSQCPSFNVTVEQGDIFVINTNVWYHGTFVHKGAVSICIGSEYD